MASKHWNPLRSDKRGMSSSCHHIAVTTRPAQLWLQESPPHAPPPLQPWQQQQQLQQHQQYSFYHHDHHGNKHPQHHQHYHHPQHHPVAHSNHGNDLRQQNQRLAVPMPSLHPGQPGSVSPRQRNSFLSSSLANLHEEHVHRSPSLTHYRSHHAIDETPNLLHVAAVSTGTLDRVHPISETPLRVSAMPEEDLERLLAHQALETEENGNVLNCVLVGDHNSGKTSLVNRYVLKDLPVGRQEATVLDHYNVMLTIDGTLTELRITDTGGLSKFSAFRRLSYPKAHVFMLCVSVAQPSALRDVQNVWLPEIRRHNAGAPVILVGTKTDVRLSKFSIEGTPLATLAHDKACRVAKEMRSSYVECSAYTGVGLKEAFDEAIWHVVKQRRKAAAKLHGHGGGHGNGLKQELKRALSRTTSANPAAAMYRRKPTATTAAAAGTVRDRGNDGSGDAGCKKQSRKFVTKIRRMFRRNAAAGVAMGDVQDEGEQQGAAMATPSAPKKRLLMVSHSMNV